MEDQEDQQCNAYDQNVICEVDLCDDNPCLHQGAAVYAYCILVDSFCDDATHGCRNLGCA